MFKHVIVKTPCTRVTEGIASIPALGSVDAALALRQHAAYVEALKKCGVAVTEMPPDEAYPDSCFVEDVAVLTPRCAVVTVPGAPSRRGETEAMIPVLQAFYKTIEYIREPGTLDGGDVMVVHNRFYVGRTARTNAEGIRQLRAILKKYGYTCATVPIRHVLHLKTGVNYLDGNNLLLREEFAKMPCFADFNRIVIPPEESYAANSVWVNGTVMTPAGCPQVKAALEAAGYPVITVDTSEFQKIDGGLGCLSLRF